MAEQTTNINWYPGHMAKGKRQMAESLNQVDLLIEVLDARAPRSSRNPDLAELCGGRKPHLLLLNKADLANPAATKAWLSYYRDQGFYSVATNAAQKQGVKEISRAVAQATEPLMQRLEAKGRNRRPVRAMVVGIPNSGKSTVINALCRTAAAKTGNQPGVTKGRQWVKTAVGIELLDTPGVLWPKFADQQTAFHLAVIGSISDLVYPVEDVVKDLGVFLLAEAPQALCERFKLDELPADGELLLYEIGRKRGLLAAGGVVRMGDAALLLLREFRAGRLGKHTLDRVRADRVTGVIKDE